MTAWRIGSRTPESRITEGDQSTEIHISTDGYGKEVNFCGLVILSNIIDGCDRFLAFN